MAAAGPPPSAPAPAPPASGAARRRDGRPPAAARPWDRSGNPAPGRGGGPGLPSPVSASPRTLGERIEEGVHHPRIELPAPLPAEHGRGRLPRQGHPVSDGGDRR